MKKSLLTVAFAMVAMVSSAQFYVGGSLGFNTTTNKASYDGKEVYKKKGNTFNIAPEIGWAMNETLSFGATINLISDKAVGATEADFSWNIKPYARYTFHQVGNISCFADGVLGYGVPAEDWNYFSIAIRPGITVSLTDNLSLISTVDLLGWETTSRKEDKAKASTPTFGIINNAAVGVFFTF